MPEGSQSFRYVAVASTGKRVRGVIEAASEAGAYERLRAQGCAPLRLAAAPTRRSATSALSERETIELVGNLGRLLQAGADMRTALAILGARSARGAVQAVCAGLSDDIAAGGALDTAFARRLGRHGPFVGALVAAGAAGGDIGAGLGRAADTLESRLKLRSKLGSILAYPLFVLVSTIAAVLALLIFVVPALAPLVQDVPGDSPVMLGAMIAASDAIRGHATAIGLALAACLAFGLMLGRAGLLAGVADAIMLSGPFHRTACALTFGGFAIVLGGMLSAGAPMSDALRLSIRTLGSGTARSRLEPVLEAVRQGRALSGAIEDVRGFPTSIARLTAVGEAIGSLGPMLVRGGALEEEAAMARIERLGQILGPTLIVALGALVGLLMAGLLSGVSQLGQSALQ